MGMGMGMGMTRTCRSGFAALGTRTEAGAVDTMLVLRKLVIPCLMSNNTHAVTATS